MATKQQLKFFDKYPFPSIIDVEKFIKDGMRETFDLVSDKNILYPENPAYKIKNVIIVGCGYNEALYHALRNPKINFIACDVSQKVIDYNIKTSKHFGLKNIEFIHKDLFDIDANDIDIVFAKNVLTFLDVPKLALKKLNTLLVKNGALILSVPNGYHFQFFDIMKPFFKNINIDIFDSQSIEYAFKLIQGLNNFHPAKILITDKDKFMTIENFTNFYLSPIFNHFTIKQISSLCNDSGFVFQNWFDNSLYFPSVAIRNNQVDHPSFFDTVNNLELNDKWDSICRLFGPRREHFFHTMCLRNDNKYNYYPYNLLTNDKAFISINPSQKIVFVEASASSYAVRANMRFLLSKLQEKIIKVLNKPLNLNKAIIKLADIDDQETIKNEINALLEASILRIHL